MKVSVSLVTSLILLVVRGTTNAFRAEVPKILTPFSRGHERNKFRATPTFAASSFGDESSLNINVVPAKYGGLLTFKTKLGYVNLFSLLYGATAIFLGLPWFVGLTLCQIFYKITGNNFDKLKRIPITLNHLWGVTLLVLTRSWPKMEGRDLLEDFYKEERSAMFVANHNSWMDIPFLGATIGWRNYKIIAKAELKKVPILGKAICLGGHVLLDRSNLRSQLRTLKAGMQWLKDGVHLCTFPEGTRSKTGRLLPFKNGAFKMAHKNGSPVIPLSIIGSGIIHPTDWIFPMRRSEGVCKVIVHEPIESFDKTESELAEAVRNAIIKGLPEEQRPTSGTNMDA